MSTQAQPEQEIVTGIVQGIVQKAADKWQVEVNTGQQNPRRIWTKDANMVGQLSTMIGQNLSFVCGVSHWTNQQNQPIKSLWLNGYGPAGAAPMVQQPVQQQQQQSYVQPQPQQQGFVPQQQAVVVAPQQGPNAWEKDQRIMREAASKVAVQLLPFIKEEERNFQSLLAISERLVAYYEQGAQWPTENTAAPGQPVSGAGAPAHTDDDIPF